QPQRAPGRKAAAVTLRPVVVACAACVACSWLSPQPDRTRFYVLAAITPDTDPAPTAQPVLGLGPISLPSYLDRPQLVTRLAQNELKISEGEQWAEPLGRSFGRVIEGIVWITLGAGSVGHYRWQESTP